MNIYTKNRKTYRDRKQTWLSKGRDREGQIMNMKLIVTNYYT